MTVFPYLNNIPIVHMSIVTFQNREKNSFQLKIVIAGGGTVGLAEGIIDDPCIVFDYFIKLYIIWAVTGSGPIIILAMLLLCHAVLPNV